MDGCETESVCECEAVSHSEFGPVVHEESVGRVVRNPMHLNKSGDIKIGLFPSSHIRQTGLSLLRLDHTTPEEALVLGEKIANTNDNSLEGLAIAKAETLRDITVGRIQALCVVDTPLPENGDLPAISFHADALQSIEHPPEDIEEIRNKLLIAFRKNELMRPEENDSSGQ